jgi:hypothetical protein
MRNGEPAYTVDQSQTPRLKARSVGWLNVVMVEMEGQLDYVSGTTATHRGYHICGAAFGCKTQGEWECSIVLL